MTLHKCDRSRFVLAMVARTSWNSIVLNPELKLNWNLAALEEVGRAWDENLKMSNKFVQPFQVRNGICNTPAMPCYEVAYGLRKCPKIPQKYFFLPRIYSYQNIFFNKWKISWHLSFFLACRSKMWKACKVCGQSAEAPYKRPWNLWQAGGTPKSCPDIFFVVATSWFFTKIYYVGGSS